MNMHLKIFIIVLLAPFTVSNAMVHPANKNNGPIVPKELHAEILTSAIKSSTSLQEATQTVRSWAHVNRHFYEATNNADVTIVLLRNIAKQFSKSLPRDASRNWECYLRTAGAGRFWGSRSTQHGVESDPEFDELYFKWAVDPDIHRGDRRLSLFVMTYFPVTLKSLQRILDSLHHDQGVKDRDNSKIIQRVKEMYVAQCVKRVSHKMKSAQ